jgi:hypothetical protein
VTVERAKTALEMEEVADSGAENLFDLNHSLCIILIAQKLQ